MYGLLTGTHIVEAASFIAAPLCGLTFAQLGADVIRIDPIGGGPDFGRWPLAQNGLSYYWEGLNKSKRSIAIDLSRPAGREIAVALITRPGSDAGYFITNYPSTGFLSHEQLSRSRKDLVTVRVTGSSDGRNALDYTVNCAAGYPMMTGSPETDDPINHVLPAWDIAAGLTAAVSVMAAANHRRRTGEGQEILVPLSNVAFGVLSALGNIGEVAISGKDRPRYGNALYGSFGHDFVTADKRRLMIVAITQRQWTGLLRVLKLETQVRELEKRHGANFLTNEGERFSHRDELFDLVQRAVGEWQFEYLTEAFDHNHVCWGEYQTVRGALQSDPRVSVVNPMFEKILHPSGESYIAAGYPGIAHGLERISLRPAPRLGANTDEILASELSFSAIEIGRLHDAGLVANDQSGQTSTSHVCTSAIS